MGEPNGIRIYLIFVIILFVSLIVLIKHQIKVFKENKLRNLKITEIDKMTGEDFEKLLKAYFEDEGYKVSLTPKTNDYGADLILRKKKETIVVQAKRYNSKVGNKAVQEIVSAKPIYKATKAIVVTNNYFTKNAINLAKANDVALLDRKYLLKRSKK